ncbi:heavy-metal-associated domain-containing protein [Flavobacteriaceae bacterium MAR_2010_105]|nr:heavy-metal-associated domain-containing protein [Flavobacteriaceae bacterium MAR_2010_105]
MKKIVVLIAILTTSFVWAQDKNAKATIEVDGICMMCKVRIEKASIKTKGVKSAIWDVETHELKLIFDERKTNLKAIKKNIAAVGHDTKDIKATKEAYDSLDPCCKYKDEDVVNDHKN